MRDSPWKLVEMTCCKSSESLNTIEFLTYSLKSTKFAVRQHDCSLQTQSSSKQMVDLENKPETSTEEDKKEQTFGLRTDQYAKKALQVVELDCLLECHTLLQFCVASSENSAVLSIVILLFLSFGIGDFIMMAQLS